MKTNMYILNILMSYSLCCIAAPSWAQPIKEWDKTIGGSSNDNLYSTTLTPDGGYLLAGYSDSPVSGDKSEDSKGLSDYWVVKIDADGHKQWDKTYGGSSNDILSSVTATSDGGYLLVGSSYSNASGDKSEVIQGGCNEYGICTFDYWIVKIDGNGNKIWNKATQEVVYDNQMGDPDEADPTMVIGGGFILIAGENNPHAREMTESTYITKAFEAAEDG